MPAHPYNRHPPLTDPRQEHYCELLVTGSMKQGQAFLAAFGDDHRNPEQSAMNLNKKTHIRERIESIRRERNVVKPIETSKDGLVSELVDLAQQARLKGSIGHARDCLALIAQLQGHLVERKVVAHTGPLDSLSAGQLRTLENIFTAVRQPKVIEATITPDDDASA